MTFFERHDFEGQPQHVLILMYKGALSTVRWNRKERTKTIGRISILEIVTEHVLFLPNPQGKRVWGIESSVWLTVANDPLARGYHPGRGIVNVAYVVQWQKLCLINETSMVRALLCFLTFTLARISIEKRDLYILFGVWLRMLFLLPFLCRQVHTTVKIV